MSTRACRTQPVYRLARSGALALSLVTGLALVTVAPAQSASAAGPDRALSQQRAAVADIDDDVVLPSRVAAAISRTENALRRAELRIDDRRYRAARRALKAVAVNVVRAHRAGINQMTTTS